MKQAVAGVVVQRSGPCQGQCTPEVFSIHNLEINVNKCRHQARHSGCAFAMAMYHTKLRYHRGCYGSWQRFEGCHIRARGDDFNGPKSGPKAFENVVTASACSSRTPRAAWIKIV
jgi:hypothetical protein